MKICRMMSSDAGAIIILLLGFVLTYFGLEYFKPHMLDVDFLKAAIGVFALTLLLSPVYILVGMISILICKIVYGVYNEVKPAFPRIMYYTKYTIWIFMLMLSGGVLLL